MEKTAVTNGQGVGSPAEKPTNDDEANATTSTVAASEHGQGGDTTSSANQVATNKTTEVVDPGDSNMKVASVVKWHATVLLLLTHVVGGRVMEARVNANPVVSETTSRLQNTLAGNPNEAKLTEGDVMSSSFVSVLLMNKPTTDELCDRVNNPDTDILLIDGMNGMGSVVHSSGPQCTPCEQTQDLKVFQALSLDDLNMLFSNNVTTSDGRKNFAEQYNRHNFQNKFIWKDEEEKEVESDSAWTAFMKFKKSFDVINTLMISMEEGNHRLLASFFTLAGRKAHPMSKLTMEEPTQGEKLTPEYLRKEGKNIDQNKLTKEGGTDLQTKILAIFMGKDAKQVSVNGLLCIPIRANTKEYPVKNTLRTCVDRSTSLTVAKHVSSERTSLMEIAEIMKTGNSTNVVESGVVFKECFYKSLVDGKLAMFKLNKKDGEKKKKKGKKKKGEVSKDTVIANPLRCFTDYEIFCTGACITPKVYVKSKEGDMVMCYFAESYSDTAKGAKDSFDLHELNLLIIGPLIFEICLRQGGMDREKRLQIAEYFASHGYFNLSFNRNMQNMPDIDYLGEKIGDYGNDKLANAVFLENLLTAACLFGRGEDAVRLIDSLGRDQKDQTLYWEGMRLSYGQLTVLTTIQYRIITHTLKAKGKQIDMGFMRNMLYFANVEMLMSVWLEYGFNPPLKTDLQPDRFTDDEATQEYFTGEHEGTIEQALELLRESLKKVIGDDVKKLSNVYDILGWNHLYTSSGSLVGYNKLMVALWVYVWDKVTTFVDVEKELGNNITWEEFDKNGLYFWKKKFRKVPRGVGGETTTLRQNLEAATPTPGTEEDKYESVRLQDYQSVSSGNCTTFPDIVGSLFEPLVENTEKKNTTQKLSMGKHKPRAAKKKKKRKKKKEEDVTNLTTKKKPKKTTQADMSESQDDESRSGDGETRSNNTENSRTTAVTTLLENVAKRYDHIEDKTVLLVLQKIASTGESGKYSDLYNIMAQAVTVGDAEQDVTDEIVDNEENTHAEQDNPIEQLLNDVIPYLSGFSWRPLDNMRPTTLMFMSDVKQAILDTYNTTRDEVDKITMEQCNNREIEYYSTGHFEEGQRHAENLKQWLGENNIEHSVYMYHMDEDDREEDSKRIKSGKFAAPPLYKVSDYRDKEGTTRTTVLQVRQKPTKQVEGYIFIEEAALSIFDNQDYTFEAELEET